MRKLTITVILCAVLITPCMARGLRHTAKRFKAPAGIAESDGDKAVLGVVVTLQPSVSLSVIAEPATEPSGSRPLFRSPQAPPPGLQEVPSGAGSRDLVNFYATGGPGAYPATNRVVLVVSTNLGGWGILCQATPLVGEKGEIGGNRVFVRSDYTGVGGGPDEGVGPGFVSLGQPRVIGRGSESEQLELPLDFKLLTENIDKAGNYTGTIVFSYMPAP